MNILEGFVTISNTMTIQTYWVTLGNLSTSQINDMIIYISKNSKIMDFYNNILTPHIIKVMSSLTTTIKTIVLPPVLYTNFIIFMTKILIPFCVTTYPRAFNSPSNVTSNDLTQIKETFNKIAYTLQIYLLCSDTFCSLIWVIINSLGIFFNEVLSNIPKQIKLPKVINPLVDTTIQDTNILEDTLADDILLEDTDIIIDGSYVSNMNSSTNNNNKDRSMTNQLIDFLSKYKIIIIILTIIIIISFISYIIYKDDLITP